MSPAAKRITSGKMENARHMVQIQAMKKNMHVTSAMYRKRVSQVMCWQTRNQCQGQENM